MLTTIVPEPYETTLLGLPPCIYISVAPFIAMILELSFLESIPLARLHQDLVSNLLSSLEVGYVIEIAATDSQTKAAGRDILNNRINH